MEFVLALAIIGLFALEMHHRGKTQRLGRGLLNLTERVNTLSEARTDDMIPSRPARRGPARCPEREPDGPDSERLSARRALTDPAQDALADALPEVAAAAAVVTMGLGQRKRVSPIAAWFRRLRTSEEWEALIGGRLMNRIGAIALILGMGFFLKYAIDQNWIGQVERVGIGVLVGAGLLALAARAHRRGYEIFGQGLVGAGQAVLYLSVFASYNFYHLVPQPVALAGMALVTAVAFAEAIRCDSLAVSLLACLGGYLTPFLLNSPGSGAVGTIGYLAVLNVGVLGILSRRQRWGVLEPIAIGATFAAYFAWYASGFSTGHTALAGAALTLFWAQFLAFDVWASTAERDGHRELRAWMGAVNVAAYISGLFAVLGQDHASLLAGVTMAAAAVYAAVLVVGARRGRLGLWSEARFGLSAIALLVLATAISLRGFPVAILWTLEALALLWIGVGRARRYIWGPAVAIYALAFGVLFGTHDALAYGPIRQFWPVINPRDVAYLMLIGSLACGALALRGLPERIGGPLWKSFQFAWTGLTLTWLAVETSDVFLRLMLGAGETVRTGLRLDRSLTVAAVWIAFSLALGTWAWRKRVIPCVLMSLAAAGLAAGLTMVAGITYQPIEQFVPVINVRVAVFVLVVAGLGVHLRLLARQNDRFAWARGLRVAVQVLILTMGFELVLAEVNDYFMRRAGHSLLAMDLGGVYIELAVLSVLWAIYALLPTWFGVKQRAMPLIVLGLSMTAAATGVAALGGIALQPSHELGLALGVRPVILAVLVSGLLAQLRWIRGSTTGRSWHAAALVGLQAAIILVGFGLVSVEIRDAFARAIAGATGGEVSTLENVERLAFSLVWLGYAIGVMGLGIWRRARWMRLGAMALLAGVILKVFVYDLSFLGTVYRPVSLAGLGVVLLAVSFLYQRYRKVLFETR
jgi:uncharacterized membrane protein